MAVLYKVLFSFQVKGSENIPPEGGVIIAANHLSYLDPPLIVISIKRRVVFTAKASLFTLPFIGWFVRRYSIPVYKDAARPSTFKEVVKRLKNNEAVVLFLEGMRIASGDLGEGKRGVGLLAAMTTAKIVPALIEGTDKALPVGAKFIKLAKVRVTFGPPVEFKGIEGKKDTQQKIADEIIERIRELRYSNM